MMRSLRFLILVIKDRDTESIEAAAVSVIPCISEAKQGSKISRLPLKKSLTTAIRPLSVAAVISALYCSTRSGV